MFSHETASSNVSFIGSTANRVVNQLGYSILSLYEERAIEKRLRIIEERLADGENLGNILRRISQGENGPLTELDGLLGDLLELTR